MGIWVAFKDAIFFVLQQIQLFVGDWGLAIICLTVLIRLILWPLTVKQVRSTVELQKVQPQIKAIQTKYADDKEKQQEELMKFYAEHKVNPFASCLPMLLQMPIFIALYQVLGGTAKNPGTLNAFLIQHDTVGSFYGIIKNIALSPSAVFKTDGIVAVIPYAILVVLFGLSVWLPQALMPGEKSQKMIGLYMAVFMLFMGWTAPAGVLLYWDTSSLLGIVQQQLTQSAMKRAIGDSEEIVVEASEKKSKKSKKSQS